MLTCMFLHVNIHMERGCPMSKNGKRVQSLRPVPRMRRYLGVNLLL